MQRTPEQLPDPWLFDSEALLRELDRCRELVLQIPIDNPQATHFGINNAISAIWNLTQTIRSLLHLHRDGQRAFAAKATTWNDEKAKTAQANLVATVRASQKRPETRRPKKQIVTPAIAAKHSRPYKLDKLIL